MVGLKQPETPAEWDIDTSEYNLAQWTPSTNNAVGCVWVWWVIYRDS